MKKEDDKYPNWRERWCERIESRVYSRTAEIFLDDLVGVFRKWGLCLSHEDGHGAFIIEPFNEYNVDWLRDASLGKDYPFEFENVGKEEG